MTDESNAKIAELEASLKASQDEMADKLAQAEATLNAVTKDKNDKISAAQDALLELKEEMDQQAVQAEQTLAEVVSEKDAQIAQLRDESDKLIADKDAQIADLQVESEKLIADKDAQIADLQAELEKVTTEKDARIAVLESTLQAASEKGESLIEDYESQITALNEEKEQIASQIESFMESFFSMTAEPKTQEDFDFLGTWYVREECDFNNICVVVSEMGIDIEITFNEDQTGVYFERMLDGKESVTPFTWELSDDVVIAYLVGEKSDLMILTVDKKGKVFLSDEDEYFLLTREAPELPKVSTVKKDVVLDDFLGNWQINGCLVGGLYIPLTGLGMESYMNIYEDGIDFSIASHSAAGYAYELVDGGLQIEIDGIPALIEALEDGTTQVSLETGEGPMYFVFTRAE